MNISHQLLQKAAASCRTNPTTSAMLLSPLGRRALSANTLPLLNPSQHQLMRHRQYHGTAASNNQEGTQHHIIPSADEQNILTNDPSTIKRNFRTRLSETKEAAQIGGGPTRIDKQHAKGSLTARERISLLFDGGSFREVDALVTHRCSEFEMDKNVIPGDGVVVGKFMHMYIVYL